MDFHDCKVFVTNVDSQASCSGGVIVQVLGELSNKGAEASKFCQTFFLAEQPEGYYVLNDIFRYLKEDIETGYEDEQKMSFNYQENLKDDYKNSPKKDLEAPVNPAAVKESLKSPSAFKSQQDSVAPPKISDSKAPSSAKAAVEIKTEKPPHVQEVKPKKVHIEEPQKPAAVPSKPSTPSPWSKIVAASKNDKVPTTPSEAPKATSKTVAKKKEDEEPRKNPSNRQSQEGF